VQYTEPGCRVTARPAAPSPRPETGPRSQVPLFLTTGEKVKVDTRDGSYLGRVTG
jgi:elongation factor P